MRRPRAKSVTADKEIAELIEQAHDGSAYAKEMLFEKFEWFLLKYKNFFKSEADAIRITRQYPDVAAFLGLFMSKKSHKAVRSSQWSGTLESAAMRKINELVELAREIGDEGDMDGIIDLTFMELIDRYDPKGKVKKELKKQGLDYSAMSKRKQKEAEEKIPEVGFEGYLINVFKWRLYKNINSETRGVIPGIGWCKSSDLCMTGGDTRELKGVIDSFERNFNSEYFDMLDDLLKEQEIGYDWVSGDSCSYPFDQLTVQERWILKSRFVDNLSYREMSESIGCTNTVMHRRFNEIKSKIKETLDITYYDIKVINEKNDVSTIRYSHYLIKDPKEDDVK